MIGDKEDSILQQTMKRLLITPDKERAQSLSDVKIGNEQLSLLFDTFENEATTFMETLDSEISRY